MRTKKALQARVAELEAALEEASGLIDDVLGMEPEGQDDEADDDEEA